MKLTINFGNELKHAKIKYPKILPVTKNCKFVGEALIRSDGMAELNIVNEQQISGIKDILELGVGGVVTSREGNLITGFSLQEVSIQLKDGLKVIDDEI
jgi:hypothetical protein